MRRLTHVHIHSHTIVHHIPKITIKEQQQVMYNSETNKLGLIKNDDDSLLDIK